MTQYVAKVREKVKRLITALDVCSCSSSVSVQVAPAMEAYTKELLGDLKQKQHTHTTIIGGAGATKQEETTINMNSEASKKRKAQQQASRALLCMGRDSVLKWLARSPLLHLMSHVVAPTTCTLRTHRQTRRPRPLPPRPRQRQPSSRGREGEMWSQQT